MNAAPTAASVVRTAVKRLCIPKAKRDHLRRRQEQYYRIAKKKNEKNTGFALVEI